MKMMNHILFEPVETSRVSRIRPADKKALIRASRESSPMMRDAIDDGRIKDAMSILGLLRLDRMLRSGELVL